MEDELGCKYGKCIVGPLVGLKEPEIVGFGRPEKLEPNGPVWFERNVVLRQGGMSALDEVVTPILFITRISVKAPPEFNEIGVIGVCSYIVENGPDSVTNVVLARANIGIEGKAVEAESLGV